MPLDALGAVVEVLEMGAKKYAPRNWERGLSWSQTADSLLRHVTAWYCGEQRDPESGLLHLSHVACNALFLLAHELRGIGTDDRPSAVPVGITQHGVFVFSASGRSLGHIEPSPLGPPGPPPRADGPSDGALDAMTGTPPQPVHESSPPGYLAPLPFDRYGGLCRGCGRAHLLNDANGLCRGCEAL